jgi:type IV pilus assembly protein PilN
VIRINLLGVERHRTRMPALLDPGRQATLLCSLVLVVSALGIGWWYWSLAAESRQVDEDIAAAQQEQARLQSVLTELRRFEARRTQLQQRVQLIEQLRGGQSVPVQVLDHVSRSLPDMLWLTSLRQDGDAITIEGRSTNYIALSDFVGNLGSSPLLRHSVEIVKSVVESQQPVQGRPPVDVTTFTVKAQVASSTPQAAPGAAGAGGPAGAGANAVARP